MLYAGMFRNHRNGIFVELGAVDGVSLSNTKFFQETMGWSGLLIEPSVDYAFLVEGKAKYGVTRPANSFTGKRCSVERNVKCVNAAVCKQVGWIEMLESTDQGVDGNMVSGAVDKLTEKHKAQFSLHKATKTYKVPCKPFGTLLHESGITRIDLLSLDVEGSEETVLETMDWSIPIHVIVIEANINTSPTGPEGHERKHRILLQNGFQLLMTHEVDEWWVNPANVAK
jgi:FkbM family methyltransferase